MLTIRFGMLVLISICLAIPASMCEGIDLSTDLVYGSVRPETQTRTAKLYVSSNKVRLEMSKGTFIYDCNKKLYWRLFPEQKVYSEHNYTKNEPGGVIKISHLDELVKEGAGIKTFAGTQMANGYLCRKIVYDLAGVNPPSKVIVWYSDKLHCPIKLQQRMQDTEEVKEYKNIKAGKQDASLFKVPEGYKKVEKEPDTTMPVINRKQDKPEILPKRSSISASGYAILVASLVGTMLIGRARKF